MGITHEHAIEMLKGIPGYAKPFEAAFPSDKDRITMPNVVTAIAAFEATLITPNAPFDKFLRGDANALSAEQKGGVEAIHRYGLCQLSFRHQCWWSDVCPILKSSRNRALIFCLLMIRAGLRWRKDRERPVRVPRARTAEHRTDAALLPLRPSVDLNQAVGIMATDQLGKTLTDAEVAKIVAFLSSLTGEQPQVVYPILPPSVATSPTPQQ